MKRALIVAGLLLGVGLLAAPAQAQTGTARGKVLDAQGQPVVDAKVLIEFQGGITRKFETKTNKKGEYMQVGMQPGPYRFTVNKEGFQGGFIDARISLGDPTAIPDIKLNTAAQAAAAAGQRRVGAARPVRRRRSSCRAPASSTRRRPPTRPSSRRRRTSPRSTRTSAPSTRRRRTSRPPRPRS